MDVTAAVIRRGETVLIARRHSGDLAGLWEFPGGKLEPGETPEACLAREIREELGLVIRVGCLLDRVEHAYPTKRIRLWFYAAACADGVPSLVDHDRVAWVRPADLGQYVFAPADAPFVERLLREPLAPNASPE